MEKFVRKMKNEGAKTFNKGKFLEIRPASIPLVKAGVPAIPRDYTQFLTLTNGLVWNGLYLLPYTCSEDSTELFTGVVQVGLKNSKHPFFRRFLVLGYCGEEKIVFTKDKHYQIISNFDYRVLYSTEKFIDILSHYYTLRTTTTKGEQNGTK